MIIVAVLVGYLIGSIPSAGLLGRLWGVQLRDQGSGNPGTVNALRTAGPSLAASVLIVEAAKGYGAVWAGSLLAGETGAIAAGLAAIAGNVYNLWYRFHGGKGLGISLGILAGVWPLVLLPVLVVLVVAVIITRSSGTASLIAIAGLAVLASVWVAYEWPTWGVAPSGQLLVLAVGMALILSWKHWRDSPLRSPSPP